MILGMENFANIHLLIWKSCMKHIPGQHVNDVNQRANDLVRIFWALDFGSHVKYWPNYHVIAYVRC